MASTNHRTRATLRPVHANRDHWGPVARFADVRIPPAGIVVLVLAIGGATSVGCGPSTKPPATTATTATTASSTTTTADNQTVAPITGTDDHAVQSRLRNGATVELTLFTDQSKFTADVATLENVDPTLKFADGVTPPANPEVLEVAVSPDGQWACLTGRSAAGHVFVMAVGPNVDVYAGTTAFRACTSHASQGLQRANG